MTGNDLGAVWCPKHLEYAQVTYDNVKAIERQSAKNRRGMWAVVLGTAVVGVIFGFVSQTLIMPGVMMLLGALLLAVERDQYEGIHCGAVKTRMLLARGCGCER